MVKSVRKELLYVISLPMEFDTITERIAMSVNDESEIAICRTSADLDHHAIWQAVQEAAEDSVRWIPFDMWQPGEKQVSKQLAKGLPHVALVWETWYFHRLGEYGGQEVHLGVDGVLYELDAALTVRRSYEPGDFSAETLESLRRYLGTLFRQSDDSEALFLAIETELARIAKNPRPKVLGIGCRRKVITDVPMPGDGRQHFRNDDGTKTFFETLRVWRLPYVDYLIDEKGRLVSLSRRHKELAVVHLRSIMERTRLRTLYMGLLQTK